MQRHASVRWNAYPALLLAGAFAVGVGAGSALPGVSLAGALMGALGALGVAVLAYAWPARRLVSLRPLGATVALGVAVAALGTARTASVQQLEPGHVAHLLPPQAYVEDVTLHAQVESVVERAPDATRFTAALDTIVHRADTLAVHGRVRVSFRTPPWEPPHPFPAVRQGDRLRLRGTLRAPPGPRNPGAFDYGAYLRRRGVHALATADAPGDVVVDRPADWGLAAAVASVRTAMGSRIDRYVRGEPARAVVRALVVGDRAGISEATHAQFASTGLLHLLAISGLHVLLVGMVVYRLLRPGLMRLGLRWTPVEWVRAGATLFLLVGFALLTGGRPSVTRAVVMAGLFIGSNLLQRSTHALNTLGVAALLLLAARPLALFDAGFQLSFAAVGAIVTLNPRIQAVLPTRWQHGGWRGHLSALVTVSLAATLGTMPVLLAHFGYVSFAGIVLNVVAIPVTALTLLSGGLTAVAGGSFAGPVFGASATTWADGLLRIAGGGDAWFRWAAVEASLNSTWTAAALVLALAALAQWPRPRLRWRLVAAALLVGSVGTWNDARTRLAEPTLEVIFFDVGQGDAALVSLPNGKRLLIDAGPRSPYTDAGASVLVPYFERAGIDRLDAVVVSHADSDHLGGLPAVLQQVRVGRILFNPPEDRTQLVQDVDSLITKIGVPTHPAYAGDTLALDPAVHVQVLSPPVQTSAARGENDASLVVRLVYRDTQMLFAGDVEASAEQWLVHRYGRLLASDIVKVGHHGSSTSSQPAFVAEAATEGGAAVVSAGARNPFGFPHPRVVRRWRAAGTTVARTAEDGAVWFRTDGRTIERVHWQ